LNYVDWIGFVGVAILLLAFLLNLQHVITKDSLAYLLMNFIGAVLACLASVLLRYWPFIILEACWAVVSGVGLLRVLVRR
jgi:hypothetical protein